MKKPHEPPKIVPGSVGSFFQGVFIPFRGLGFLAKRPEIWYLVLIPLIINTILFIAALILGYGAFSDFLRSLMGDWEKLAWYMKTLAVLARLFFWILALFMVYYVFTPVALVIASPFNDRLAETTEEACGFKWRDDRPLFRQIVGEASFAIRSEVKRMFIFGLVFIILLPLNLIPIVGSAIYVFLSFVWACFGFAFEFISFATDRRHVALKRKLNLLWEHLPCSLGFGFIVFISLLVPFVNIFMVSIGAVSGSILFCSLTRPEVAKQEKGK